MMKRNGQSSIVAVDLFCGAGGLSKGLQMAGIDVRMGIDNDPACRYPFEANTEALFLHESVRRLDGSQISEVLHDRSYTLVAGCAPCQPFSRYRQGQDNPRDGRWRLLGEFLRLVLQVRPDLVTMENVPRLAETNIFTRFVKRLTATGYTVWHATVRCVDYGVPQRRERLVLLASKLGPISLISPTHTGNFLTLRQAISALPQLAAGGEHPDDPLHKAATLSPTNLRRIRHSKPGGTWRDWHGSLVAACHRKRSGKTYPSVYGRMSWDEPAPTVTTQFFGFGNGRFGHPDQDRAISLREGAIIQSFPKDYRFVEPGQPIHFKTLGRLIGNAVPVRLGEAIGRSLMKHVRDHVSADEQPTAQRSPRCCPIAP